jgi:hypothetical protein
MPDKLLGSLRRSYGRLGHVSAELRRCVYRIQYALVDRDPFFDIRRRIIIRSRVVEVLLHIKPSARDIDVLGV